MSPARIKPWKLVIVESPYGSPNYQQVEDNKIYARACLRDCLARHESPIASHLLLTQQGVLDDSDPHQRREGFEAGHAWIAVADEIVVYQDLGISAGMWRGIKAAEAARKPITYRYLYGDNR